MRDIKYSFIIETDSYAGNFEREMCAYCTGQIGDCEVGKELAEKFKNTIGLKIYEEFEEIIEQKPDDHGVFRPVSMCGLKNNNFEIYFYNKPTDEMIIIIREQAKRFPKLEHPDWKKYSKINILGFKLMRVETTQKEIEVAI